MKYNIDLNKISISQYKIFLKKQYLIPSRKILHEDIDNNFEMFEAKGIKNLLALKQAFSTSKKIASLAEDTQISTAYLNILKRELKTFNKAGIPFNDFPIIDDDTILKLNEKKIKNTKDFYEYYHQEGNEKNAADELDIPLKMIRCLVSLSDLTRINGVGALAATMLYEAGYTNIEDIATSPKEIMLKRVNQVDEVKKYYKANLGLKDMQFIIDFASLIIYFDK